MIDLASVQQAAHHPGLLATAVVLLLGFVALEGRQQSPLIPLQFFRSRTFTASGVLSMFVGIVLVVALVNVPIFAYTVLGQTYMGAGLTLLRLTVMIPLGAFAGGWLVSHIGTRTVGVGGAAIIAIGLLLMSRWTAQTSGTLLTLGTAVTGLGFGLVLAPISTTALHTTDAARFGVAAAISTTLRMVGMILGLAALTSWEISRFQQLFAQLRVVPPGTVCAFACMAQRIGSAVKLASSQAMAETFFVAAGVAALALLPALYLRAPLPRGVNVVVSG